jgi:hypothetical protein
MATGSAKSIRLKTMPVPGGAGPERQFNTLAAVQTHTHSLGEGFDGSLSKHDLILNSQAKACLKRV